MGYKFNPFTNELDVVDSKWEVLDTGTYDYLQPINEAYGLIIGAEAGVSELVASFNGASAFFIDSTGQGLNYYVISGIGTSFVSLGGTVMSTAARGTAGAETQIPNQGILGVHAFAAYDGNNYSINFGSGAYGVLPGLYAVLASDPTADAFDLNVGIQALLGKSYVTAKMRNSSQNLVVINDANDDIDFQVNWDTGTALLVEGSSGTVTFGGTASFSSGLGIDWGGTNNDIYANTGTGIVTVRGVNGVNARVGSTDIVAVTSTATTLDSDLLFALGTARTIKPADRTDGAGAGYALSILGGSQTASTGNGGAVSMTGGTGTGLANGGAVTLNGGIGLAAGATNLATTRGALNLSRSGGTVGFFGVTATTRSSAYTPTNVTADRSYDANSTTIDELADVLGTLIADLQLLGLIG